MTVRAKFQVMAIWRTAYSVWNGKESALTEVQTIEMIPVTGGIDENKAFFAVTPSGKIELSTVNKEAAAQFELLGEYYVDFTPAKPAKQQASWVRRRHGKGLDEVGRACQNISPNRAVSRPPEQED